MNLPSQPSPAPIRTFSDAEGSVWRVYEQTVDGEDASSSARPSLIFETDGAMRRVASFPSNWMELTATELEALSWRR